MFISWLKDQVALHANAQERDFPFQSLCMGTLCMGRCAWGRCAWRRGACFNWLDVSCRIPPAHHPATLANA